MKDNLGDNSGSKASPQAPAGLGPSGYGPGRWPHTMAAIARLKAAWRDYRIASALRKRGWQRSDDWILMRKRDGRLFAPGSPQNFGYAMRGLFQKNSFHFYRVREWHGLLVASRKVFWIPASGTEFTLTHKFPRFDLPPWPEDVECCKIDAAIAASGELRAA